MAILTVIGMYQYDNTLFDYLHIPKGLNKDVLINKIIIECQELETLLPDIEVFKWAINNWSMSYLNNWTKLLNTENLSYNPIENYDRVEEFTTTDNGSKSSNDNRNISENESVSTNTESTQNSNYTTAGENSELNQKVAFNSGLIDDSKRTIRISEENNNNSSLNGTSKDVKVNNTIDTNNYNENSNNTNIVKGRAHGNIGVTTTQQMLQQEREVAKFNLYDYIAQMFKERFCILIY